MNACHCPRTGDKVIRVMVHKDVGLAGLDIIRSLSTSRQILIQNNHILPLLDELPIGDLVFGIFPLLRGPDLCSVMHMGALNNVADIMDLLLQAFEVGRRVPHLDRVPRDFFSGCCIPTCKRYRSSGKPLIVCVHCCY